MKELAVLAHTQAKLADLSTRIDQIVEMSKTSQVHMIDVQNLREMCNEEARLKDLCADLQSLISQISQPN